MDIEKEKQLINYSGDDKIVSSFELNKAFGEMPEAMNFKTKIPTFDRLMGGLEAGELIIMSGATKHGKTLFCQTLTKNLEEQNLKCLWFEFEVPYRQFITKFPNLPLFYLPKQLHNKNISWIKERIKEAILKHNTRIVFIDELHFVIDMYSKSFSLDIGQAMRDLKSFAIENEIVLVIVAHIGMLKEVRRPVADDIRDSSFITQIADSTVMIWREFTKQRNEIDYTGFSIISVENHRRTGTMSKSFKMRFNNGYFYELDEQMKEEEPKIKEEELKFYDGK